MLAAYWILLRLDKKRPEHSRLNTRKLCTFFQSIFIGKHNLKGELVPATHRRNIRSKLSVNSVPFFKALFKHNLAVEMVPSRELK